jgi:hypothetical protein
MRQIFGLREAWVCLVALLDELEQLSSVPISGVFSSQKFLGKSKKLCTAVHRFFL